MGVLFAAFTVAGLFVGAVLWVRPRTAVVSAATVLCGSAIVAYVATRLVAFPQLSDDVGNWLEPWGVVSVSLETLVVLVGLLSRRLVAGASPHAPVVAVGAAVAPRRAAA